MMKKNILSIVLGILMILALPIFTVVHAQERIEISGASTIQPIIEQIGSLYVDAFGGQVEVSGGGSGRGVEDAISGSSDIGMVSRSLSEQEAQRLEQVLIGLDSIVFVVNQANPLTSVTKEELIGIYSGEVNSWAQLGWEDRPIQLISKEIGRSTLNLFEEYSGMKNPNRNEAGVLISGEAVEIGANLEAATLVGGIPNGIGYLSVGTAVSLIDRGMPIKTLQLDGVEASQENILNETYPILRELNLVYREDREYRVSNLIDFVLSDEGQRIVEQESFIPVTRGGN